MCGIVGGFWRDGDVKIGHRLQKSLCLMRHRGPDDDGYELNASSKGIVALGQTRLSIIDLSSAGHQPMLSLDERYALVFNGEIYNYRELRDELRALGCTFITNTDTEVLLQAWSLWGVTCVSRLQGMFAFVVHDRRQHVLTCVRDAFGIKPFLYAWDEGRFVFASEQSALLELRGDAPQVDWQRSYDYLVHGDYDSQERTFIEGVKHLLPAHCMSLDIVTGKLSEPLRWWQPSAAQRSTMCFKSAAEAVREQFLDNVRLHMRSDVLLGAALSGGVDSSAVVCAMRHLEPDATIHTFSYIATDSDLSEEYWVDHINAYVGATPHKVVASGADLARDLDDMIIAQGEPFGSTSIYAQYLVFQLAKQAGITVTLDGQGADELLAGYIGYPGQRLLSLFEEAHFLDAFKFAKNWSEWPGRNYMQAWLYLGEMLLPEVVYKKVRKALGRDFSPPWLNIDMLMKAGISFQRIRPPLKFDARGNRVVEQLIYSLQKRGLPGLLRHADRNSMRFSLESRVPFLTKPMADLLFSFPENYLISNKGETKSIFRAAMRGIVPDDVLDRKDKIGFATPEKDWLLGMAPVLREWLQVSDQVPFINRDELLRSFDLVVAGKSPFSWQVWRWVNFVRWYSLMEF